MLIQGSAVLGVGTMLTLLGVLSPQQGALLIVAKFIGAIAMRPMMQLITQWKQVVTARDAYDRLKLFMAKLPERTPNMPLPPPRGFLEVKGLSTVAPGGSELILRDVTFAVQPGRVLAVIGPSGSGKSSLARMLTGIWGPRQGEVRLDGVSVSQWDKGELGPFVGYLPQDVALFDGSIAENVSRFGDPDALELARVLNATGLADWIGALPEGPETQLGEEGLRLSGGQRQRLGLARAMYGQPQLLVLDEPNSSLDEEGDRALASAILNERARGATIVLITHRPELLAVSDLILVLNEGRPQMFGPRDQVVARLNGTDASK
jgi:ATP-binding cassette subfamily C exporter for protease/lipase